MYMKTEIESDVKLSAVTDAFSHKISL